MNEAEKTDLLFKKIKLGVRVSFSRFLKDAIKNNKKLVTMRNGKVVTIPARDFKNY